MTSEPGAECPECRQRLTDGACSCGWRPSRGSTAQCAACGAATKVELDDDEVPRCAACHVTYLRARSALDPIDPAELERCREAIASSLARFTSRLRGA